MLSKVFGSSKWSLSFEIPHQRPVCISVTPIRATCPSHFILLDCMILIIFGKQNPSRVSSLHSFLRPPVTPCPPPFPPPPLCSNISASTLLSHIVVTSHKKWCLFVSASDLNMSAASHLVGSSSYLGLTVVVRGAHSARTQSFVSVQSPVTWRF